MLKYSSCHLPSSRGALKRNSTPPLTATLSISPAAIKARTAHDVCDGVDDNCSGDESDENDEEYMDSDEDENGNLKGFVVNDTDEDEDYSEEDEEEYEE